ncbi:MAG: hypothetical protein ACYDC1_23505, partial [Limisphaerales bacterium]
QIILSNPKSSLQDNVTIYFRSGTYDIDQLALPSGTLSTRQLFLRGDPAAPPMFRYKAPTGTSLFNGPTYATSLFDMTFADLTKTLAFFEARDLVLDANWPAWTVVNSAAHPAYFAAFKLGALAVRADAGAVRGVRIKNCGAKGQAPVPHFGSPGGAETFPLFVEGTAWTTNSAWLVEDCEVSDFHFLHNGYCTAIMVKVPNPSDAEQQPTTRIAEVRRCLVRGQGAGVAFGTAGAAGVSFHDNVVTGMRSGLNCDTAPIRNLNFTNSVVLDVDVLGNVGAPYWSSNPLGNYAFTNFVVSGNAVRLRAVPLLQDYSDFEYRAVTLDDVEQWMPVSDPSLAVGRFFTGMCAGLQLAGTDHIWLQHNRFTTRPRSTFFEPDVVATNLALWRPLYRPSTNFYTGVVCDQTGNRIYANSNWLAGKSMDFTSLAAMAATPTAPHLATNAVTFTGFTAAGWIGRVRPIYDANGRLQEVRELQVGQPVVVGLQVFVPFAYVRHTSATGQGYSQPSGEVGLAIVEGPNAGIQIAPSTCYTTNFIAYTRNSASGCDRIVVYADFGASPFAPDRTPCWSVVEAMVGAVPTIRFERTPDVANDRELYAGTLRIGRSGSLGSELPFRLEPVTSGMTRFADAGVDYDLYTNSWATPGSWYWLARQTDGSWPLRIQANQPDVTVRVRPRIGAAAKSEVIEREAAFFRVAPTNNAAVTARPGRWTTPGPANTVAVALWDGPKYTLSPLSGTNSFPCGGGSLAAMEAEGEEASMEAPTLEDADWAGEAEEEAPPEWSNPVALEDGWEEAPESAAPSDMVVTRAGTMLPLTAEDYAPKPVARKATTEYPEDPPPTETAPTEVTLDAFGGGPEALSGNCTVSLIGGAAYAIDNLSNPAVGGYGLFGDPIGYFGLGYSFPLGGWWVWPATTTFNPMIAPASVTNCIWGLDDAGKAVGVVGDQPVLATRTPLALTPLPTLDLNPPRGVAEATSPNGNYLVGWSEKKFGLAGVQRPAKWTKAGGVWSVADLGQFESSGNRPGYARAVNDAGNIAGWTEVTTNGVTTARAFRTQAGGAALARATDELYLPTNSTAPVLTFNWANAISAGGHAVGVSDFPVYRGVNSTVAERRPAIWWNGYGWARVLGPAGADGTPAWISPDAGNRSGYGEALGIRHYHEGAMQGVEVVGSSWITSAGSPRAWVTRTEGFGLYSSHKPIFNLNDRYLTYSAPGWILVTAEAVNANGWIVGTATGNGAIQGYVLVPQAFE